MRDLDLGRQRLPVGQRQRHERLVAQVVLHRDRLSGPQQRAIEDRVRDRADHVAVAFARLAVATAGGQIEAPALDPLVPVGPDEREVGAAGVRSVDNRLACRDEITGLTAAVVLTVTTRAVLERRKGARGEREAARVGRAAPRLAAVAVGDAHLRTRHRLRAIERGHPDPGVDASELRVHAEVRDQRGRPHVHRCRLAEQGGAEALRLDLDDVEARLRQRDADDLERSRVVASRTGQRQRLRGGVALQQAQLARRDLILLARFGARLLAFASLVATDALARRDRLQVGRQVGEVDAVARDARLVIPLDAALPLDQRRIALSTVDVDRTHRAWRPADRDRRLRARHDDAADRQRRLHVAHRQRQHRVGIELEDAERRRRELRQRRRERRLRLQREQRRVRQRPARIVDELLRRLDRQLRVLRERRLELDLRDRRAAVVGIERRMALDRLAAIDEPDRESLAERSRDRRCELDTDRADRRAGSLRVLALAREARGEVGTDVELQTAFDGGRDAARRRDALAPEQRDVGAARKPPRAGQHRHLVGALVGPPGVGLVREREALQQFAAIGAFDELDADALTDARDLAPGVREHARRRRGAVQRQHEDLLLVDACAALAGRREVADDRRAAGREGKSLLAADDAAVPRLRVGPHVEVAAHPRPDVVGEVVDPRTVVDPATAARRRAADVERRRELRIAEVDHRAAEGRAHLADDGDLVLRRELLHDHRLASRRVPRRRLRVARRAGDDERREEARDRDDDAERAPHGPPARCPSPWSRVRSLLHAHSLLRAARIVPRA